MSTNKINLSNSNSFSEHFFTAELFCDKKSVSDCIHKLIRKNFNKETNYSEIYYNADISKQNWSNYISGKNIPNQVNARKLVVGLRCTLDDAEMFLGLCGFQFVNNSKVDDCIKQCLKDKIFNMVDVYIRINQCSKSVA